MSSAKDSHDGGGFVFVPISHPSESAGWKRKVRSHAAKGIWARRQRVAAYQQANAQSSSPSDGQYPEGTPPLSSSQHPKALTLVSCRGSSKPDHRNAFPPGPISFLSAARTDPFNSYNRVIAPWEKRLLDHFLQYLILEEMVSMPSLNIDIAGDNVSFWTSICTYFLQASLSDPGMLATTLLYSCRHMAAKQRNEIFSLQATRYRLHCIQSLNQTLTREGKDISQLTIAKTIALASDAYFTGEYDAAEKHLKAVGQMARVKDGGLDSSDFLGRLIIWFAGDAQSKDMIGTLKLNFDTETAPVTKVDKNLVYHVSAPASRDGRD